MRSWYLVYTKPRRERTAKENLERQAYATYLPLIYERHRRAEGATVNVGPMFPRYVFVNLSDVADDWGPIRSTTGVIEIVKFGAVAATIPDALIAELRAAEDTRGVHPARQQSFSAGDAVRIAGGPMAGYEGVFQAHSGSERVVVLLQLAESSARLSLHKGDVVGIEDHWNGVPQYRLVAAYTLERPML